VKHIVRREYGRIPRVELGRFADRLQAFDERLASGGETVFDWGHRHYVRAKNYVGVVQVPGVTVEILPKIDDAGEGDQEAQARAQRNLLYMLSVAGKIPARTREVAALGAQRRPLLEALVSAFARRLLRELRRGVVRDYVLTERNSPFFKGKLLVPRHVRKNFAHRERAFVGYDEFVSDTQLNRILKATCRRLVASTRVGWTERCLRESLLHLAEVSDVQPRGHHFDQIQLSRNSERFAELLGFSRLVHRGLSPAPEFGETPSFSLLFPMDRLFEEFVGETIRRNVDSLCPAGARVRVQARGRRLWLLRRPNGKGAFRLKPDVVVDNREDNTLVVLDTKWKRLKSDVEDARNGVALADVYQLYTYIRRYRSSEAVLLFPRVPGVTEKSYLLDDEPHRRIRVAFVDMSRDLAKDAERFLEELRAAMRSSDVGALQDPCSHE